MKANPDICIKCEWHSKQPKWNPRENGPDRCLHAEHTEPKRIRYFHLFPVIGPNLIIPKACPFRLEYLLL